MKVLQLTRLDYLQTGIFGTLIDPDTIFACYTLEHSYAITPDGGSASTNYAPKVPHGSYICQRRLSPRFGYDVFCLTNVPGHDFIEIHRGNTEKDSEGCILLGLDRQGNLAVLESSHAFTLFMKNLEGIDQFILEIS